MLKADGAGDGREYRTPMGAMHTGACGERTGAGFSPRPLGESTRGEHNQNTTLNSLAWVAVWL
jgi:hypothetical protein